MAIPVRALLREKGTPYAELGLADPKWSDDELIDFMLVRRFRSSLQFCRESVAVLDLLNHPADRFVKEDGEIVLRRG
jgi:arsenate reductase